MGGMKYISHSTADLTANSTGELLPEALKGSRRYLQSLEVGIPALCNTWRLLHCTSPRGSELLQRNVIHPYWFVLFTWPGLFTSHVSSLEHIAYWEPPHSFLVSPSNLDQCEYYRILSGYFGYTRVFAQTATASKRLAKPLYEAYQGILYPQPRPRPITRGLS